MNPLFILRLLLFFAIGGWHFSCEQTRRDSTNHAESQIKSVEPTIAAELVNSLDTSLSIGICSFNIKFVGFYKKKDHDALADLLKEYDLVLIQELVSPPVDGTFPNGNTYQADVEAKAFAEAMESMGFTYVLSSEDTGTNEQIHSNSSSTEWFIAFYKPNVVVVDTTLVNDFLAEDRSDHPSFGRVPHAFSFETLDGRLDFTLISVHFQPGSGSDDRQRRKEEIDAIADWIDENDDSEKDYLIVGDMNIHSQEELVAVIPTGFRSLNENCLPTNLATNGRPYDHVFYRPAYSDEVVDSLYIVDLVEEMRSYWNEAEPYPENDLNLFYQYYSDHKPIVFEMVSDGTDDD